MLGCEEVFQKLEIAMIHKNSDYYKTISPNHTQTVITSYDELPLKTSVALFVFIIFGCKEE